MPQQPLHALALLVSAEGKVVTREELRRALWQGGTFVDVDRAINKAINQLRQLLGGSGNALCDDAAEQDAGDSANACRDPEPRAGFTGIQVCELGSGTAIRTPRRDAPERQVGVSVVLRDKPRSAVTRHRGDGPAGASAA